MPKILLPKNCWPHQILGTLVKSVWANSGRYRALAGELAALLPHMNMLVDSVLYKDSYDQCVFYIRLRGKEKEEEERG